MTINLYPVIYWSILESLGVLNNFIGVERNCFCVIQKSQIYIALSLQQTHLITLYVAMIITMMRKRIFLWVTKLNTTRRRWYKQCLDAFLKMLSSKWPINIFLCQTLWFNVILLVEFAHLFQKYSWLRYMYLL